MKNFGAKKYKASEGRRTPRLQATFLMKYFLFDGTPGENIARTANTKDLSPSGIRFTTTESVPKNALIRIQVLVPVLGESPISAFARVTRSERMTKESVYSVSADFLEMPDRDYDRLSAFIESRLNTREHQHLFAEGTVFKRVAETEEK